MTAKHRLIEITTIIAVTVFIVFMVRSCGETVQAVSTSIEMPSEPVGCESPRLRVVHDGDIVCINCGSIYRDGMLVDPNEIGDTREFRGH